MVCYRAWPMGTAFVEYYIILILYFLSCDRNLATKRKLSELSRLVRSVDSMNSLVDICSQMVDIVTLII